MSTIVKDGEALTCYARNAAGVRTRGKLQIDLPGLEVFSLDAAAAGLIDAEYISTEAQSYARTTWLLQPSRRSSWIKDPEMTGKLPSHASGTDKSA